MGAGATATGLGAAVGSGAFFSAEAERGVSVSVENDADAFLGLGANREEFAEQVDNEIVLQFDELDDGGDGISPGSTYRFEGVIEVVNQGTQEIQFGIDVDTPDGVTFDITTFLGLPLSDYPANRGVLELGESSTALDPLISIDEGVDPELIDDIEVTYIAEPTNPVELPSGAGFGVVDEDGNVYTEDDGNRP